MGSPTELEQAQIIYEGWSCLLCILCILYFVNSTKMHF